MAEIVERRPSETVVVERERDHYRESQHSNAGIIIAVVILILLFLLFIGHGLLNGSGGGGSTDVKVTPSTSNGQ